MIQMSSNSQNETSGNGQFGSLTRRRKRTTKPFSIETYNYLALKDRRMNFNNTKDPIYYVFDCLENRPIQTLAKEFVKDSFNDIFNFVSKVVA